MELSKEQAKRVVYYKPDQEPQPGERCITLTQSDLHELGRILHKNILSKSQLITAVEDAASMSVEDVIVSLEPRLLTRLRSRCIRKEDWDEWLAAVVIKQLHDFAGY